MAVLDAFDARLNGTPNRLRRVSVNGYIGAPVIGRLDRGAQFGFGESGNVQRTMGRRHTAAGRQLDLRRAQHQLLAHAHTHLVGTIGNHAAAHSSVRVVGAPRVRGSS